MLNFWQWCKTCFSAFSLKFSATTPNCLHVFGRAPSDLQLCFVQLKTLAPSARYSTFKYPVTLKPGLGSLKVIENYKTKSGIHDFLLTFHSHHRPISHRFRDIGHIRRKSPIFPTPCIKRPPMKGFPLEFRIGAGVSRN